VADLGRVRDDPERTLRRCSAAPGYTAEVVDRIAALDRVEAFHRTHPAHPASHLALLRAGFLSGWKSTPFFVQVARDGEPCLLMVGQLVRERLRWRLGYGITLASRARTILVRRGGLLGDVTRPALEFLREYLDELLRRGGADAIHLRDLPSGSGVADVFASYSHWLWRDRSPATTTNWRLRVPASFDEWQNANSRREREDTKRYDKRIRRDVGDAVRVEIVRQLADVDRAAEVADQIARKTYQRGIGAGFRDSAPVRARWRAGASEGALDVRLLWFGDQPVAYTCGFVFEGTLWLEHLGYDPAFRRFRPGMFLLLRLIEDLAGRGDVHTIDFGIGDADYKRRLCDQHSEVVSVYVFAPTLRGLWLNSLRATASGLGRVSRACLGRLGLLPWVRTSWRRSLEPGDRRAANQ
jgi:Acetyltransferase (GNAT) domain